MNQPKVRSRKELYDYLHHTLGFTRVKTATPGERLYAHLVPGTKRLWIPLELTGSDRDIVDRVMRYARSMPPSPSKIPERFKIRKVGKKVVIYEERKTLPREPKINVLRPRLSIPKPRSLNNQISAASRKVVFSAINRIVAKERKEMRENRERAEVARKMVDKAIKKITADEKKIKTFVASMIGKIVRQHNKEAHEQTMRNRKFIATPRVPTRSAQNLYTHKQPALLRRNISNSLTYQRLRNQGHSDKVARQLIEIFEDEADIEWPEPPKKKAEEDLAEYLARWEENALKYPSLANEEYEQVDSSEPVPHVKRTYGMSVQIPVQLRRRHKPDYKLYR